MSGTVQDLSETEGEVRWALTGRCAVVTLDRPHKLNAFTAYMTERLAAVLDEAERSREVGAVLLTGSGRAFCAGSDIGELDHYETPWAFGERRDYGDIVRAFSKPIVAAINGPTLGGGLELALSCDVRVCSVAATFAAPEIKLGWIGGSGQCALLAHAIGSGRAAHMVLTGEPIDAPTALGWGLVSQVVEGTSLLETSMSLGEKIASNAPLAAQAAKRDLQAASSMSLVDAIAWERQLQTVCFGTEDAAEGRAAFKERRQPQFRGR